MRAGRGIGKGRSDAGGSRRIYCVVRARNYGLKLNELHSGVNFTQNIWWFGIWILTLRCNYYTRVRLIWKKTCIATAIRIRRSQLTA